MRFALSQLTNAPELYFFQVKQDPIILALNQDSRYVNYRGNLQKREYLKSTNQIVRISGSMDVTAMSAFLQKTNLFPLKIRETTVAEVKTIGKEVYEARIKEFQKLAVKPELKKSDLFALSDHLKALEEATLAMEFEQN